MLGRQSGSRCKPPHSQKGYVDGEESVAREWSVAVRNPHVRSACLARGAGAGLVGLLRSQVPTAALPRPGLSAAKSSHPRRVGDADTLPTRTWVAIAPRGTRSAKSAPKHRCAQHQVQCEANEFDHADPDHGASRVAWLGRSLNCREPNLFRTARSDGWIRRSRRPAARVGRDRDRVAAVNAESYDLKLYRSAPPRRPDFSVNCAAPDAVITW